MEFLSIIISTAFPIIFTGYCAKRFSINLNTIFSATELKEIKENKPKKEKKNYKDTNKFLLWSGVFCIIFSFLQIILFKSTELLSNTYEIIDRMAYLTIYPFLPGLFIGMSVAATFMYYSANKSGVDNLKKMLLSTDSGITGYQQYKFAKGIIYVFPILALIGNNIAFSNYIGVKSTNVVYQEALSQTKISKPISEIVEIVYFSKRKGPNGKIYCNIHPTLFFEDGSSVHTLNLIYSKDIEEFIQHIAKKSKTPIPTTKIDGYRKSITSQLS